MTNSLEKAFAKVSKLSNLDQDAFAAWIIAELEAEERWTQLFQESQDMLEFLADEALAEFERGETMPLDPSTL